MAERQGPRYRGAARPSPARASRAAGTVVATAPVDTPAFPDARPALVALTELLDRVSIRARDTPPATGPAAEPGAERTFDVEVPAVGRPTIALSDRPEPPAADEAPAADAPPVAPQPPPVASAAAALPSWAVATIGGLSLLSLALAVALALAVGRGEADPPPAADAPAVAGGAPAEPSAGAAPASVQAVAPPADTAAPSPADFPADPAPIPVDLLTRLEEASDEPLAVELTRLLDAVGHGFGRRSARLEPTLRSYVYRTTSRFAWSSDTFRVAVTAPDPALAAARGALLDQLFADAVAAGRLQVGTGTGPHALTLVSE